MTSLNAYQAVIKVPVVDCFCFSMPDDFPGPPVTTDDDIRKKNPRECQLLFNEVVEVLESKGNYILVELPSSLCYHKEHNRIEREVWIVHTSVMPLSALEKKGISACIPPSIYFSFTSLAHCSENIVTLTMPFDDPITKQYYSAGTRFVRTAQLDTPESYAVLVFNSQLMKEQTTWIPQSSAHLYIEKSPEELIDDFVALVQKWAHQEPEWLAYVWGGSSFVYLVDSKEIHPGTIYCGYDCSGLIMRAAQIVGIPYYLRDSTTINHSLKPIDNNQMPRKGDIIWFRGHVMIISSVENNLLTQARGYGSGYGRLYEASLNTMFKGINTYADLMAAYKNHQPLQLLHRDGSESREIQEFKIFPLLQLWQN